MSVGTFFHQCHYSLCFAEFFEEKVVGADGKCCSFSSQRCDCCPYGYHIDLDFLQFLNSLYDAESLKKLKRFKRGSSALLSPVSSDDCLSAFSLNLERMRETENVVLISDGDDVSPHQTLDEFDASLCRTTAFSPNRLVQQKKHCKQSNANQLSDATATDATVQELSLCLTTSDESIDGCSTSETSVEQLQKLSAVPPPPERHGADASASKESSVSLEGVFSVEDGGRVSPTFLLAIREQLVLSLRRTKELEEEVKVIPILKSHISMLKEENSLLTLTPDRTFSNAAVGDFPVFDDAASSKAEIPLSTGGRETVETSELISSNSDFEGNNPTEGLSTVSLKSTSHPISSLPLDSNFKTVYCCVGVSNVAKAEEDSRNVGILSQATTSDSCIGSDVDFVDCGTGDETVSYDDDDHHHQHQTFNKLTKQHQSPSETAADMDSRSTRNGDGEKPPNASLVLSKIQNFDELESPTSSVGDPKRFQSVATQCEDGDKTGRNDSIESSDFQPTLGLSISNVQQLSNSRSTQTDKFLIVEYSSKIVKIGDRESVPSVDDGPAVNVVKATETSKKRISFGEVTIFETEISDDDDDLIIDEDTSSTDCETDTGLHNGAEDPGNHQLPSHAQKNQASTTVESVSPDQSPIVECIVTEGVLESPQCGLSVIIDDSSESSTTTSSDSEDSSALTILEAIPNGKSPSISIAVKSVDEYFDAAIVEEENSTVDGGGSGENLAEDGKDDEVVLVINETSSLPTTNEEAENADKLPGKFFLSFNLDGQTETTQCNQHSIKSLANSASDESSVNCKTDSETFISYSSSSSSKSKTSDERINLSSEASVDEVTVDCFPRSVFPVTDHLEVIQVQKKHQKNPDVISAIEPQVAKGEVKSRSQMSTSSDTVSNGAVSNDHSDLLNYGQIAQSSMTKKKIVITETIIERRRIDKSPFDDQTQLTEDRSFGSEDLKDDDHSRRFVGFILLMHLKCFLGLSIKTKNLIPLPFIADFA